MRGDASPVSCGMKEWLPLLVGSRAVSRPEKVVPLCFLDGVERAEMSSLGPSLVESKVSHSPRVAVLPGPGAPLTVAGEGAAGNGRGRRGAEPIDLRWRWPPREPPIFLRRSKQVLLSKISAVY